MDASKSRSQAIAEAVQRTEMLLEGGSHVNPLAERIRLIRDEILRIAIEDKKDYIRNVKGKHNRIGHNWEACVEFFVDKLTKGAEFLKQTHRSRMDRRRITLKLLKPVGERKMFAEVVRVWTIRPSPISQPITYVLECKWGLVRRKELEGFLSVLKWSYDFGVDTPEGRAIRQVIIGIFAGTAFNPEEKVAVGNETLSLARYVARVNIQLLKAVDLNEMLRQQGVEKHVTV